LSSIFIPQLYSVIEDSFKTCDSLQNC
jgi:hypothetical protein